MAVEYSTSVDQTIPAGGSAFFDLSASPCRRGLVYHRDGSTQFRLASPALMGISRRCGCGCGCGCGNGPIANYAVAFHGNLAIPTGGTVEAIQLSLALDGEPDPASLMISTPTALEAFNNVGTEIVAEVPWICRCTSLAVRNTSTQPVTLRAGATLTIEFDNIQR